MPAPIGSVVAITYDANDDRDITDRDYLRTPTGRTYKVLAARRVRSAKCHNRWRLSLLVVEEISHDADPTGMLWPLVFYPRGK